MPADPPSDLEDPESGTDEDRDVLKARTDLT
jgi:hypothetical protein